MRHAIILLTITICLGAVEAAGGIAPGGDGPKVGGPLRGLPSPIRLAPTLEVERLVLGSGDAIAMARWAELAAAGYRVVAAVQGTEGTVLFLERNAGSAQLQLPAVIERDAAAAEALRSRLQAVIAERQRAMHPQPAPAPVPAPLPDPAAAPAAK